MNFKRYDLGSLAATSAESQKRNFAGFPREAIPTSNERLHVCKQRCMWNTCRTPCKGGGCPIHPEPSVIGFMKRRRNTNGVYFSTRFNNQMYILQINTMLFDGSYFLFEKMKYGTPSFPKQVFTLRKRRGKLRKFVLCGVSKPTTELQKLLPCETYRRLLYKGMKVHVAGVRLDT